MPPAASPNPIMSFVPIIAIFLIFYFLIIRPQQKQQREHDLMLEALKKGDRVLLNGGLFGTIVGFRGDTLELKIAENVKVLVARSAVAKLANESTTPAPQGAAA
ncbi:MAG: preprotein translocase subunit YajC [Elusimicrobia bacterium]|nr:preprotein translocase subunit YajC [Elusimicrobiota bacterium]